MIPLGNCSSIRFVMHVAGNATYPAGSTFGPRTLHDFEFVWINEGNVMWEVAGLTVPAPSGTLLLGRPGMTDFFRWDAARRTRHSFIHFHICAGLDALPPQATWPLSRTLPANDILRPLFAHVAWLLAHKPTDYEELAQGAMRHILTTYIVDATATAQAADPAEHPLVRAVLSWIQEQWKDGPMDPPTLGDCARVAGVTRTHLARVFKAELGLSPIETLRLMRLDRAASLLARTNASIADIAALTGFPNAFHFSKVFRATFGRPPREHRAAVLAGEAIAYTSLVRTRPLWGGPAP